MSTEPPQYPPPPGDDSDPFRKQPPRQPPSGGGSPYDTPPPSGGGSPYDTPPPGGGAPYGGVPPGPGDGGPYGGGPGGYGGQDPLAGMPPLADSGKRVLARIIDMILVGVVVGLLSWAFGTSEYDIDPDEVNSGRSFGQSLLAAVLYIAYDTFMISRTGQTLGKKWLGMRVANLNDGATPSMQTALARAAVLWLPFAFCCACIWTAICGGWSFFDKPYKQGLHDKAAKTVVVST
ncbi:MULTISPECIES: RDD family protein [unclassified Streptomyces]|uniref:RDD family protein n=1 Tax=unclassified Streptomyces TaxID=2593676 RepID=UPI00099F1AB0|nr:MULTISPECIES: RDD family protein [unclassified Streptomyces]THC47527.1 RDD family protein [Streptomyces sp. A1499]